MNLDETFDDTVFFDLTTMQNFINNDSVGLYIETQVHTLNRSRLLFMKFLNEN